MNLIVDKPIINQVTLTISSEAIQVTVRAIFKNQTADTEQKVENIMIKLKYELES